MPLLIHSSFFFLDLAVELFDLGATVRVGHFFKFETVEKVLVCCLFDAELFSEGLSAALCGFGFVLGEHVFLQ